MKVSQNLREYGSSIALKEYAGRDVIKQENTCKRTL